MVGEFPFCRIAVVGTSGSGKSTLASRLAKQLVLPYIELDALNWEPNWTSAPVETLRVRVEAATRETAWVIDGNYGKVRDIIWLRAQAIIWLDYSLATILWRLWWRTMRRCFMQEELWSGNREGWRPQFFSRDSIFLWALQTYNRRKQEYPELLARPEYSHLQLFRFTSPAQANRWLDGLPEISPYA